MIKFKFASLLFAALWMTGCAELQELTGQGAPIEERGVATAGAGSAGGPGTSAASAGGAQSGAEASQVETHPLPTPGLDNGQALGTDGQPLGAANGMAGNTKIVGVTPEQARWLSDPAHPLSKRVVFFDFDSDAIREEFRGLIEAHAGFLKDNGAARIILQGHTDERGSRDYNLALGQRRAESVKQALTLMGVQSEQVETVSLGEEKPVDEGHDEAAWSQNRRAEIHYLGE
ncbi:MAG: peptidoglycan-associated lipoprotein Pal [Pseudomonadota bacterium]